MQAAELIRIVERAGGHLEPDGALVSDRPDHACLIAYGNGRRMAAAAARKERGIKPPMWWEL